MFARIKDRRTIRSAIERSKVRSHPPRYRHHRRPHNHVAHIVSTSGKKKTVTFA